MEFKEVWKHFQNYPTVHLATIDKNHPRVRPMTLILYKNELWMVTHSEKNKVSEIRLNQNIEFSYVYQQDKRVGCIRATGKIDVIESENISQELSKAIIFFKSYWNSAEDNNFTLLKLILNHVYYSPPTEDGIKYLFDLTDGKESYTEIPPYRLTS